MPLTLRSIGDNDIFRALLSALIDTEIDSINIDEKQEKERYYAQQEAISQGWNALIALIDAHMIRAFADSQAPDPDPEADPAILDTGDDGGYDLRELYRLHPNQKREDEPPAQAA